MVSNTHGYTSLPLPHSLLISSNYRRLYIPLLIYNCSTKVSLTLIFVLPPRFKKTRSPKQREDKRKKRFAWTDIRRVISTPLTVFLYVVKEREERKRERDNRRERWRFVMKRKGGGSVCINKVTKILSLDFICEEEDYTSVIPVFS